MAETRVGAVFWLSFEGDHLKVVLGTRSDDDNVHIVLQPEVLTLARAHPLFTAIESALSASLFYEYTVALATDGTAVQGASIAGARRNPLESAEEVRQRTAAPPTQAHFDELLRRRRELNEAQARAQQAALMVEELQRRHGPRIRDARQLLDRREE